MRPALRPVCVQDIPATHSHIANMSAVRKTDSLCSEGHLWRVVDDLTYEHPVTLAELDAVEAFLMPLVHALLAMTQTFSRGKQTPSPRQCRYRLTSAAMNCCLRKSEAEDHAMPAALEPDQAEAPRRAALYYRVSTGRQAESDLSIPDQRRQALAYCAARGWDVAIEFVEPGASGTDARRPELQRLLDMGTAGGAPFDVVLVHSFSRFARDHSRWRCMCAACAKRASVSSASRRISAKTR
jgi:Resolvase, N terminal domain